MQHPITGQQLLDQARTDLADVERSIREHPFLEAVDSRRLPRSALEALAGEQRRIIASDRRSFAQLAARFPTDPAGAFFLSMAEGEGLALGLLQDFAAAVGVDQEWIAAYEPSPDCQVYPAFVAWLALNGSSTDVALAFLANLAAWGANCGCVADALRRRPGFDEPAVAFSRFFASPPPGFGQRALAIIDAGLAAGDDPAHARRATRLLQAYELRFWDGIAAIGRAPRLTAVERGKSKVMARLEDYSFGHLRVDGEEHTRDLIVLPDRVVPGWWRREGHSLAMEDLDEVLDELPERLVLGVGAQSQLRPNPAVLAALERRGVQVECLPTHAAVRRYGELDERRTAAALHLTC